MDASHIPVRGLTDSVTIGLFDFLLFVTILPIPDALFYTEAFSNSVTFRILRRPVSFSKSREEGIC